MSYQEHLKKYRETINDFTLNLKQVKICLDSVLDKIKFLEDIYQTGGKHRGFSQNFKDSAFKEREELCQESSALYTILKEDFNYIK